MSWTGTISSGSVAQDAAIWLELNHAMRQRQQMLAHAVANAWPASGDTLQTHAKIEEMQQFVVDHFADCVQSHNADGSARATDYYDGKTTIDLWTLANGYGSSGMNASGFTRLLPNGSTAYGIIQADDCLCTQLVNELRAMFTRMVWTKKSGEWVSKSEENWRYAPEANGFTRAAAYEHIKYGDEHQIGFYNCSPSSQRPLWPPRDDHPRAECRMYRAYGDEYWAFLVRAYFYGAVSGIPTALSSATDVYFYVTAPTTGTYANEFDANGDGVAENSWNLLEQGGPSTDADRTSTAKIGNIGATNFPANTSEPGDFTSIDRGWLASGVVFLLRFNVAGGLTEY